MLQIKGNDEHVDSGPPFLLLLHPALGPLLGGHKTRSKLMILAVMSLMNPLYLSLTTENNE
jgi:hypothetical protein